MTDIAPPAPRLTREQLAGLIRQRTRRIGPRDRSLGPARLSAAQERLWFFEQVEPGGFTYNMPAAALLTGELDTAALVAALGAVLERHEGLRSLIHWDGAKPVQLVMPTPDFDLPVVDLRRLPAAAREREVGRRLAQQARRGFDLGRELPVRGLLLPVAADEHVLSVTFHHIACDAWSVGVFLRDLALEYAHRTGGAGAAPAPLEIQYGDFAAWQRSEEFEKEVAGHLPFWQQQLTGAPAALELPLDFPRPARQGFHGTFFARRLTREEIERASAFARGQRATLFNVLLAVFRGVLARLCGVDDLVVGTAVAGRTRREIEELVGLFINTLPLRLQVGDDPTFFDLLSRERDLALEALSHQEVPFERIVQELAVGRDNSRAPILQVLLQVQNNPAGRLELPGITMRRLELENPQSKLDLVVSAEAEDDGHYRVIWRWATALFERATMERLADRFEAALAAVLAQPELRLSQWPLLLPAEAAQLRSWNATTVEYGSEAATLVSLFEAQVDRTPEAVAVVMAEEGGHGGPPLRNVFGDPSADDDPSAVGADQRVRPSSLTYAQLDARANQLAHRLRALGVGPEIKVGIAAERSLDLVVGLYGILKAGGAYVPIDPSYPEDRIAYMIGDAAVPVLLTQSHLTLPEHEAQVVWLDDPALSAEPTTRPEPLATADHLAYTIYTSGSTGRPKGAMNAHRGIVNRLLWMQAEYGLDASDRVLQKTPFSFDVSVWEFFWPLLVGAQLVVAKPEGHKDPAYLVETIARHGVTTLHFVPSMLQVFVEASGVERCTSLRRVMASGEALPADLVKRHYERLPDTPLHNLYGPTEAAVDVTYWPTSADDRAIPIGYPVANTRIHILDARLHDAPVGVAGELLIGGVQVGRGYHGRPALTAEKFIPDPFATEPGARLYRTGDLARWVTGGGHVEYLGRIDFQVKIRGFRIELGEIESALAAQPGVREAVVTVRTVGGGPALVGYLTSTVDDLDTAALRTALAARLPEYMVPAHFLVLPEMPLNPSGKVDRKQLPAPEVRAGSAERVAPRTPLEAHLVGLFSSRLGGAALGVHDDFFALGGNSIGGALLVNQLQDELGEIVHVVTLFEASTPARLAEFLEREYPAAVAKLVGQVGRELPTGALAEGISESDVLAIQATLAPLVSSPVTRRNGRALFVLGPPRSGTTLLRVMLAGHPRLFAPPELELLGFDTLAERRAAFPGPDAFRLEGLTRAVMELLGVDGEEATRQLAALEAEGLTVHELYGRLEAWLDGRLLVDKTPTYGWDPATLARAEESFGDARYLHLVRHPYGTIRSFEEARIDQIFYRREHPYSRRQLAEILWQLAHRNILRFLATIPPERRLTVHFEALVREPEAQLRRITEFLGLGFEPAMARPYGDPAEARSRRMTDGVHAESRMLGDVKFHQHQGVDADAADAWRRHYQHDFLSEGTWQLAEQLGYDPETERVGASWARVVSEPARPGEEEVLSFQEERLWFLDQLEPGTSLYNLGSALTLTGALDVDALGAALGDLVGRQASLATRFDATGGRPRRRIAAAEPFPLPVVDLTGLPTAERDAEARRRAAEFAHGGFDLARGPLFRVLLVRLADARHLFAYCLHHSIADGWSLRILIEELAELYRARRAAEAPRLEPLPVTYADFARWQRRWLAGAELERQLAFWRTELRGAPTVLELPADRHRPAERSVLGDTVPLREGRALADGLAALAARSGATEFMAFAATVAVLLARSAGVSQVLLGVAVANRGRREIERLVGFFVNTLVLRVDLTGDPTMLELLTRVRKATLGAYGHAELPFEKLVEELQPERSLSHAPLVQVLLSYQNAEPPRLDLPGLSLEPVPLGQETAKFDLTFQVGETAQGLGGWLEYATDLFDRTTARRLLDRFGHLLTAAAAAPDRRLSQLDWLSPVERQQLLEWNATESAVPAATVHGLFAAQARRTPDAVAVVAPLGPPSSSSASGAGGAPDAELELGGPRLTYAQLDALSNQLAHRLRRLGVGSETLVAIVIERSVELSVALLGILKSGGAYLPIDPSWPSERIAYMLDDAQVPVLLTLGRLRANLPETSAVILELDDPATLAGESESPVVPAAEDTNALAYVIYTSGSTGRPKGTLNSHRGIVNRLLWMAPAMELGPDDRFLQKTPVSFDVSVWELFVPLILGARLVYAAPGRHGDPDYLVDWIEAQQITVCHFVPSMMQAFVAAAGIERCTSLRRVVASGEALPPDLVARWYARLDVPLWNLYGPTETAVEVSYHATSARTAGAPVPIGRPLPNTRLLVIDAAYRPVPPGVPGELTIGGVQVGRGYRNRPALTASMFIPDPFGDEPGARMYRTGDLARALPNGEIEYLGRIDHQVKIRGFRIELGEIEAALAEHPDVQAAVVLARPGAGGDSRLVGYVTVAAGGDIEEGGHGGPPLRIDSDAAGSMTTGAVGAAPRGRPPGPSLRDFLATRLPEYMIPTAFVTLEDFPLTPSGKVDRRALAMLEVELGSSAEFVAPRSAAEALVAEIFAEVLGVDQVSAEDDFFSLGGHSLKAIQLVSRLRAAWGLELPLKALFETPTVAGLAARLGYERGETAESPFPHLAGDGPFELSFAQGRLWFLDRLEPGGVQYNIPTALRLRGPLDPDRLARALGAVVARHETLRTRFVEGATGEPEVWITPTPKDLLEVVDLTGLPETERLPEAGRRAAAEARRPFDLTSGRLLRALLLVLGPEDHGLVVTQHHIASDGWSLGIAMADLAAFYRAEGSGSPPELAPLPVRYVEFARWQRDELADHLGERLAYWREALAGSPPVLGLATDRPRPLQPSGRGGRVPFQLSPAAHEGARAVVEARGATLFMVLLAAWQALLARHAGVDDVVVGSPVAGRLRKEVEPLVGFFVNTLALRARPAEASSFGELVAQVKDTVLAAFAHQDLPFERLVEELAPDRGGGHPPIFQVAFALQNAPVAPNFAGLAAEALEFAGTTAKFDLLLNVRETPRGLVGALEFDTDLFDRTTAARLVARFERFVTAAVTAPEQRLSQLDWLSPVERQQLLEWNATESAVPAATVHGLFAAQARRTPDAVAVVAPLGPPSSSSASGGGGEQAPSWSSAVPGSPTPSSTPFPTNSPTACAASVWDGKPWSRSSSSARSNFRWRSWAS